MNCPKCSSEKKIKSGFAKGRQRYKHKDCGYNYTVELKPAARLDSIKKQALRLYLEDSGFRSIGRLSGVSSVSVLNRIRKFGKETRELNLESKEAETVEVDEMHSYTGSKKTVGRYGLLLGEREKSPLILSSETEAVKQPESFGTK
ncbi:Transposase [Bacteroidales bacterium Barb6XT]|nr:Transposase [Bacteroidales bacterium Barb6XT]